jgi:demethylmenaquinone methyltransferase / 2-methoxy-6-polyprenyl-1,4-benzoquinol methylase
MIASSPGLVAVDARWGVRRLAFQIGTLMSCDAPADVEVLAASAGGSARKRHAIELFSGLGAHYDTLSAALSLGQDPRWRRALVSALAPAPGERVLDVATGTGMVAAELLARGCSVVGIDQSAEMLAMARARFAGAAGGGGSHGGGGGSRAADGVRVRWIEGQAEALPFGDASFDALTFTYLLRYVDDPAATMRELARVIRPGGRIASLEFGVPPWPPARAAWRLYTRVGLPILGRLVSREWGAVGRFLGPSIAGFYARHPLERITGYWRAAGLEDVHVRRMSLGGGVVMWARRPPAEHAPASEAGGSEDGDAGRA